MSQKIVIKVGSSLLTGGSNAVNPEYLDLVVKHISDFSKNGRDVIVVTSGAIASGLSILGLKKRPSSLADQQASAAAGMSCLMQAYSQKLSLSGLKCASILLTREDFTDRKRYLNAKNTITTLLKYKVIPIINENDAISVDEIRFGDNDVLSALVASLIEADGLLILTDIDGLYESYDIKNKTHGSIIKEVEKVTPQIQKMAQGTDKDACVGGMLTKIEAARIATSIGIPVVLANGLKEVLKIDFKAKNYKDCDGTRFCANRSLGSKKHWIAFGVIAKGRIIVDDGAKIALIKNYKSLLAPGIIEVRGVFKAKDVVEIADLKGECFARGIINYSSSEMELAVGKKMKSEAVHRDELVLLV
ncbi:MAG: glutamate 5-kinase [Candidatus Omnitrophota bacterium]